MLYAIATCVVLFTVAACLVCSPVLSALHGASTHRFLLGFLAPMSSHLPSVGSDGRLRRERAGSAAVNLCFPLGDRSDHPPSPNSGRDDPQGRNEEEG